MKTLINSLFIALSLIVLSCRQTNNQEITINSEWTKLNLPNGWTLYAPKNFTTKTLQGIDSEPGVINFNQDSIYLQYDSGTEILKREKCSFQNSFEKAKEDIDNGVYKGFYKVPSVHTAYIDTIDNKIAVIVKPAQNGEGTVGISFSDCETGEWLGITGTNLTIEKEKLVLEIFKTIKLTKTN
jgi:hypothetical protein